MVMGATLPVTMDAVTIGARHPSRARTGARMPSRSVARPFYSVRKPPILVDTEVDTTPLDTPLLLATSLATDCLATNASASSWG